MSPIDAQVLVLNRRYKPVAVTGAERAFGLLYSGAAHALDREMRTFDFESWSALSAEAGDDVVRTARLALKVPRVVVLQLFDRLPRSHIRFSRQNIYLRDGFTCQYCGFVFPRSKLNLDHVVPRSQGGITSWENVVCSCVACNTAKGGRTPAQARMKLKAVPRRPRAADVPSTRLKRKLHDEWLPFLDPVTASYWNAELLEE
jgi:5-methylcytosine-specific restriction endonuclease McrA